MVPSSPARRLRCLQQHEQHRKPMVVRARMVEATASPGVGPRQAGLPRLFGRRLQLGGVLLHPGEEVEALQGVGQPAVALLHLVDHGGQTLGHVGQGVDQRIAEQAEQTHRTRARATAMTTPTAAPRRNRRRWRKLTAGIEHQGDEGGDEDPQDDLAEPPEQPVERPRWRSPRRRRSGSSAGARPLAEAAANRRSRRGASGPTSRSCRSTVVSLITVAVVPGPVTWDTATGS